MGDLRVCYRLPNGGVMGDLPSSIGEESWAVAEQTTREVIRCIHPTLDSEEKRKDVIDYVQRLIRGSLGCEVFPYGSVPLKTYLPDGDIDLTALSSPTVEETLAHDVLAVLQAEERNENAEYEVKDTQFIDAEVKLVKCLVQNIVIDISFNQLGGLCTLCFLEQVDRLVGKDHLFKRSIILIKAWCYYESRILGAHHGLISTYALETLILYIFHLFHKSLNGPLAVLYRFLEYFSKFDWENYCISLKGPVRKSSLPDIVVEMPSNVGDNLMLSEEFLSNCIDMFSVPSKGLETNVRAFPQKFLNIIDPLKENNNLGRSVHRGNFYRIQSAFKYGARKIGKILTLSRERYEDEIKKFFSNTLERHGLKSGNFSSSHSITLLEEKIQLNLLNLDLDNDRPGVGDNEIERYSDKDDCMQVVSKMTCPTNGNCVSGSHLGGEGGLRTASDTSDISSSSCDISDSLSGSYYCTPYLSFSGSFAESGKLENTILSEKLLDENTGFDSWMVDEKMGFDSWMECRDNSMRTGYAVCSCAYDHKGVSSSGSGISTPDATISDNVALDFRESDLADIVGSPETLNPLSNLSGDYDSHIRSLLYGQGCLGHALSSPVTPSSLRFPSQFKNKKPWDTVRRSMPLKRNPCSLMNINGMVLGPTHNKPMNNKKLSNSLRLEEKHKVRGTGTYIPNLNGCSCRVRSSQGRGRNQAPGNHHQLNRHRHARNNGSSPTLPEKKSGSYHEPTHPAFANSHANGSHISPRKLEFGSFGHPLELSQPASDTPSLVTLKMPSSKLVFGNDQERVKKQAFQLKNEDDFPPLTI